MHTGNCLKLEADALWQNLFNISQAFALQKVGVKQVEEKIWRVGFMRYDLALFDHQTCRIEGAENPFTAKLSPMSPAVGVKIIVA